MAGEVRHSPHGAQDRATMTAENECPFCDRIAMRRDLLGANSLWVAFYDTQPLNPGHVLIVPYRHEPDFLALLPEERNTILRVAAGRSQLDEEYRPDGFNLGVNVGGAAGQTIGHAHLHLIPRHWGDVPDPRGGIRCLIPEPTGYRPVGERGDQR